MLDIKTIATSNIPGDVKTLFINLCKDLDTLEELSDPYQRYLIRSDIADSIQLRLANPDYPSGAGIANAINANNPIIAVNMVSDAVAYTLATQDVIRLLDSITHSLLEFKTIENGAERQSDGLTHKSPDYTKAHELYSELKQRFRNLMFFSTDKFFDNYVFNSDTIPYDYDVENFTYSLTLLSRPYITRQAIINAIVDTMLFNYETTHGLVVRWNAWRDLIDTTTNKVEYDLNTCPRDELKFLIPIHDFYSNLYRPIKDSITLSGNAGLREVAYDALKVFWNTVNLCIWYIAKREGETSDTIFVPHVSTDPTEYKVKFTSRTYAKENLSDLNKYICRIIERKYSSLHISQFKLEDCFKDQVNKTFINKAPSYDGCSLLRYGLCNIWSNSSGKAIFNKLSPEIPGVARMCSGEAYQLEPASMSGDENELATLVEDILDIYQEFSDAAHNDSVDNFNEAVRCLCLYDAYDLDKETTTVYIPQVVPTEWSTQPQSIEIIKNEVKISDLSGGIMELYSMIFKQVEKDHTESCESL